MCIKTKFNDKKIKICFQNMVNNKIDYKLSDDIAASVLLWFNIVYGNTIIAHSRTLFYFLNCEMLISNLLVLTFIVFSTQTVLQNSLSPYTKMWVVQTNHPTQVAHITNHHKYFVKTWKHVIPRHDDSFNVTLNQC